LTVLVSGIMPASNGAIKITLTSMLVWLLAFSPTLAQTPPNSRAQDQGEVVRVYTELVQTEVMVFDKQRFLSRGCREVVIFFTSQPSIAFQNAALHSRLVFRSSDLAEKPHI